MHILFNLHFTKWKNKQKSFFLSSSIEEGRKQNGKDRVEG